MNILIIDPADFIGGAELFTIDLINHLSRGEFNIIVATNGNPDYLERIKRKDIVIEQISLPQLKKRGLKGLLHVRRGIRDISDLIRKHKVDIVQTNSIRAHIVGALAVTRTKKKLIWIVHDFTFPKLFARMLCRIPKIIITCSKAVKQDMKKKTPRKRWEKIHVIESGIDLSDVSKAHTGEYLKKELRLKPDALLVGHVGRIDWWKGQDYLLKAAQRVCATIPRAHFVFVGDANSHDPDTLSYKEKLRSLTHALNLDSHVSFMGFQPDVLSLMKQFRVFAHTSVEPEPFGRVILEAMACGVPVIVSNQGGGPKELISHGKNGLLIDPKDHVALAEGIIKLLTSPELCTSMAADALKMIVRKYTIQKTVSRFTGFYKNV